MADNMYDWVDMRWNPLAGECPHRCPYCYVNDMKRFPVNREKYSGSPRLIVKEFKNLGREKTIFVCTMIDLFASDIPDGAIIKILQHCAKYHNHYLFQTKNPLRFYAMNEYFCDDSIFCVTLETNRNLKNRHVPDPKWRARELEVFRPSGTYTKKVITIEPIMDFDLEPFVSMIRRIEPYFVNIGADSKGNGLPEPSGEKVQELIGALQKFTEVRCKSNLRRLLKTNSAYL